MFALSILALSNLPYYTPAFIFPSLRVLDELNASISSTISNYWSDPVSDIHPSGRRYTQVTRNAVYLYGRF